MSELSPVIVTSCYGSGYWGALGEWAKHIKALSDCSVEVIALDDLDIPQEVANGISVVRPRISQDPRYGSGDLFRMEHILDYIQQNRCCFQIDIDVHLVRNFTELLTLPYDFVLSRAFAFPEFAAKRIGFVGCTGFYFAKPRAKVFCEDVIKNIRTNAFNSHLDQYVINSMICTPAVLESHRQEKKDLSGIELEMDVFHVNGCEIAILPIKALDRSANGSAIFGNHHRDVLNRFVPMNNLMENRLK